MRGREPRTAASPKPLAPSIQLDSDASMCVATATEQEDEAEAEALLSSITSDTSTCRSQLGSPAMPVTSCFVISGPHPAEEEDNHLTLMLTPAQPSLVSSSAPLRRGTVHFHSLEVS
ncbi:hypothetical protein EYF80_014437 [Liparis tanakae]|uniref:Uncharacterized protein n=1 Tax=Liparis tanakae TaxID=230148 RepID=A0A4Z2IBX1_9TELE|nr:hypothetical protein EYF80_014437 [Liparis tanakae]